MEIRFRAHRLFRGEGTDVYLDLPVTPCDANLFALLRTAFSWTKEFGFSLVELCEACRVRADFALEIVDEGTLDPEKSEPAARLRPTDLRRLQTGLTVAIGSSG